MTRTQIQLPDALYAQAKRLAERQEMSLAELVRRGLEHMIRVHRAGDDAARSGGCRIRSRSGTSWPR